jgi:hypothetical protein
MKGKACWAMMGRQISRRFVPWSSARMSNNIMVLEHLLEKRLRSGKNANGQNMSYPGPVDVSLVKIGGRTVGNPAEKAIYSTCCV